MGFSKKACIDSLSADHCSAPDAMDRSRSPAARVQKCIPPVKEWTFEKTSREGRTWAITHGGRPIELTLEAAFSPFNLSSFNDNTRKTLTLRLSKEWDGPFDCMEAALQYEVQEQNARYFASPQTPEQVADAYKLITKKNADYPRHLRVKVNTTGLQSVRYWDKDKKRVNPPQDHTGLLFIAKVWLRSLWFAEDAWGLVAEASDLMILEEVTSECPF
jgi:hypothetical protein